MSESAYEDYDNLIIGDGHLARPLTEDDQIRDDVGFTNPNLHRRVDPQDMEEDELKLREYQLRIYGIYSYRTTEKFYYDYDSDENPNYIP